MKFLIPILLLGTVNFLFFSCETNNYAPKKEPLDQGQLDSITISQHTVAPNSAIKALEKRAIYLDSFPSKDSLMIYADVYIKNYKAPVILLCHQAGYSRGAYKETAKKLNLYGYSVIALDQRSGDKVNGIINLSHKNAREKKLETSYLSAQQDIEAAIDYAYNLTHSPILLVSSSYSASLSLLISKNNPKIKAVATFSPGEYFKNISITDSLVGFDKTLFVTSSQQEVEETKLIISKIEPHLKNQFIPSISGFHGSKSLWSKNKGNEKYWEAFNAFLKQEFPLEI